MRACQKRTSGADFSELDDVFFTVRGVYALYGKKQSRKANKEYAKYLKSISNGVTWSVFGKEVHNISYGRPTLLSEYIKSVYRLKYWTRGTYSAVGHKSLTPASMRNTYKQRYKNIVSYCASPVSRKKENQ